MNDEPQVSEVVQHLSNYFEIFFWVVIGITIVLGLLFILLRMREVNLKALSKTAVQNIFFSAAPNLGALKKSFLPLS